MKILDFVITGSKIKNIYNEYCGKVCEKYNLSQTDFDVFTFLVNNPKNNTARDVVQMRMIKKALVSISVEKLIQAGYVTRENDCNDRRIQRLIVTEKARNIAKEAKKAQYDFYKIFKEALTFDEMNEYFRINEKIMAAVENHTI